MADTKISALPAVTTPAGTDEYATNQGGVSKRTTRAVLFTAPNFAAGSATAGSWPTLTAGTVLTTPVAETIETDGTALYHTTDTTQGRTQVDKWSIFRLTANGAAIGATIADYFGTNSSLGTVLNAVYQLEFHCYFTKTTAGTVTWTLTNTQTYTNLVAGWQLVSPVGGIGTAGTSTGAGIVATTTAAAALPATGSLTTGVNHYCIIRAIAECGTAGNIRLRATESAGTITPLRGSYYKARRLFAGNVGTFVA